VKNEKKHSGKPRAQQGSQVDIPEPNKIAASTSFDFDGKNLTPYGGLFPVATMLEKLGFQKLVEETLRVQRIPRVMTIYQFVLAMVLAIYIGFSRLNHIRFVANDPMLTGVLKVASLPGHRSRIGRKFGFFHIFSTCHDDGPLMSSYRRGHNLANPQAHLAGRGDHPVPIEYDRSSRINI
jgi:hypothetical protein